MENIVETPSQLLPIIALSAVAVSLSALAFAGWLYFGDVIVLTLSESGMTFCL